MSITRKALSQLDPGQTQQAAFNDADSSIATNGFLAAKINREITLAISTTSVAGDTETWNFLEDSVSLYSIRIIYTDGTRATVSSAKRIS